jgi:hypothetical protein
VCINEENEDGGNMPEEEVDGPRPVIVAHRDSLQLVTSVTLVFFFSSPT